MIEKTEKSYQEKKSCREKKSDLQHLFSPLACISKNIYMYIEIAIALEMFILCDYVYYSYNDI